MPQQRHHRLYVSTWLHTARASKRLSMGLYSLSSQIDPAYQLLQKLSADHCSACTGQITWRDRVLPGPVLGTSLQSHPTLYRHKNWKSSNTSKQNRAPY